MLFSIRKEPSSWLVPLALSLCLVPQEKKRTEKKRKALAVAGRCYKFSHIQGILLPCFSLIRKLIICVRPSFRCIFFLCSIYSFFTPFVWGIRTMMFLAILTNSFWTLVRVLNATVPSILSSLNNEISIRLFCSMEWYLNCLCTLVRWLGMLQKQKNAFWNKMKEKTRVRFCKLSVRRHM